MTKNTNFYFKEITTNQYFTLLDLIFKDNDFDENSRFIQISYQEYYENNPLL
jgi:hypothetical protein